MDYATIKQELATHPALDPELFRYLAQRQQDVPAWRLFATQHLFLIRAYPHYLRSLFPRLSREEQEILRDVLTDVCREAEWEHISTLSEDDGPLEAVTAEAALIDICIACKPLPSILGLLGPGIALLTESTLTFLSHAMPSGNAQDFRLHALIHPTHDGRFQAILAPYMSRPDLVLAGAKQALDFRQRTWQAIETAITTQPRREAY